MKEIESCFLKVKKDYLRLLGSEKIFDKSKKIISLKRDYIPMSFWIEEKYKEKGKTLFLGLSGGQGSGKTTVTAILKIILEKFFKRKVYAISIDDFYKTRKERYLLSKKISPLLMTRGVPGTHDINIIINFLKKLKNRNFKYVQLPKFDKSIDDRCKKRLWYKIKKKPDVIIFEGWCVGARAQNYSMLKKSINLLEKQNDKKMIWRKTANQDIKYNYKKIFNLIDCLIFLKIPSFKYVYKWRLLQEKKLKKKSRGKKIMNSSDIKEFIMYYERITKSMLKTLSSKSNILINIDTKHRLKSMKFN